jgi:hypothetical protein
MGLYGQYFSEEQGINVISALETIYKLLEDIGRNGMKIFKENMIEEKSQFFMQYIGRNYHKKRKINYYGRMQGSNIEGKKNGNEIRLLMLEPETY